MPGRDRRGPMGEGAATGRGMGGCQSVDGEVKSSEDFRPRGAFVQGGGRCRRGGNGQGFGRGYGRQFGWGQTNSQDERSSESTTE